MSQLGFSRHQLDALLAAGLVVQPVRGAYVDARQADDLAARAYAASLVLPEGMALARRTAAWLLGLDPRGPGEQDTPIPLEGVVPSGRTVPRRQGVLAYQAALHETDIALVGSVPTTTPLRTALDLLRFSKPFMALALLDAMAHLKLIDPADVSATLGRFHGGRGMKQARRLLEFCDPAAESFGESWLRLRILDAGFPRPESQIWIVDDDGVGVYRLDLGWRDHRVAVEYDGEEFHSSPEQLRRDAIRRDALARRWGWHVIGVGKGEVLGQSLALERGVGELLGMQPLIRQRPW